MSDTAFVAPDAIRAQLRRIIQSAEFASSPRLTEFLSYIVEEALAGRVGRIKGVTIAQAVFGADESFDSDSNSIVRVEAGRLRRRLGTYYAGSGHLDPILIQVPKGAYAPEFLDNPSKTDPVAAGEGRAEPPAAMNARRLIPVIALLVLAVAAWQLFSGRTTEPMPNAASSPAAPGAEKTEAQILFAQAFELLMPPEDDARLDTALDLFRHVSELEPNFAGGFVGQSLAHSVGVLFVKSDDIEGDLREAIALADHAVSLDDKYSLSYSAMALAHSMQRENDQAHLMARRAVATSRRDPTSYAMAGLALVTSGRPLEARSLLTRAFELNPDAPRTPYLNLRGIAFYLTGEFAAAARDFEYNLERGGPRGAHMDVFQAATLASLGREFEASAVVERLVRANPDFPVRVWLQHYDLSEDSLTKAIATLRSVGLPAD
jgi:tetratricopeptide (TPR) repeat protein